MSAKHTAMIWQADLKRPLKLVALALADSADPHGIVPLVNKKMFAWLTGYSLEELDKVLSQLLKANVLVRMPENRLRFSPEDTPQLPPYWQEGAAGETDRATQAALRYRLATLHIQPDTVDELVKAHPAGQIHAWLDIYDQAVEVGLADGAGFLVSALRHDWDIKTHEDRIAARRKERAKRAAAARLPEELTDLLQQLAWADDLEEVAAAYRQDPERTLAWARHTVHKGGKAGKFRNALRSGLHPPGVGTGMMPALMPQLLILDDSADSTPHNDWPDPPEEAVRAWDDCLAQLALMTDAERGFNSGELASWLKPAQPVAIECTGLDTIFTVRSCNKIAAAWITDKARGTVEDVLGDVLNCSITLESVR